MSDKFQMAAYRIKRRTDVGHIFFWVVQVFFGLPSFFLAISLLFSGKADGALYSIALFLAWIGATLAIGVASIIFGRMEMQLPTVFPVRVAEAEAALPEGWEDRYHGYPYRRAADGRFEVLTAEGTVAYRNWAEFCRAIGAD